METHTLISTNLICLLKRSLVQSWFCCTVVPPANLVSCHKAKKKILEPTAQLHPGAFKNHGNLPAWPQHSAGAAQSQHNAATSQADTRNRAGRVWYQALGRESAATVQLLAAPKTPTISMLFPSTHA